MRKVWRIPALISLPVLFSYGLVSCGDSSPSSETVQYMVTNKSTTKINRLTIFLEKKDSLSSQLIDSVYVTNIPDNLLIRLTYDMNKSASNGTYRILALGDQKQWEESFGSFSEKKDHDSDHIYYLEIQEDSVAVIP